MPEFSATTWNVLAFLAGALVTAVVTAAVNRWYKRPRPAIDVMSIRFAPKTGSEALDVSIDYTTTTRIHDSAILPSLDSRVTVKELGEWIEKAETTVAAHRRVMAHLQSMLDRQNLLDPGSTTNQQREAILNEWSRFGRPLEALALAAVMHFEDETPAQYKQPHPEGWKDPQRARVHLDGTTDYNLREIDVEEELAREAAVQGPVGLVDRLRVHLSALNIVRRFWIHLQERDLRWLFSKIVNLGSAFEQDAAELIKSVAQLLSTQNAEFLRIDVHIRNDGERGFSVQPEAYLTLRLRQTGQTTCWAVPIELEGGSTLAARGESLLTPMI